MQARTTHSSTVAVTVLSLLTIALILLPGTVTADPEGVQAAQGRRPGESAIAIEEIIRDGDRAVLRVRNRTPFIVMVYIGGVRIGWMRPYRVGMIRGLMSGYHRLYAHSRYGTTSWGPRAVWVPGTWNLLY